MNKTLLVSIDGLRSDAIDSAHTPTLDYLIKNGSYSMNVKTVKPSITLPAHFSIFTSLEPSSHGVLTNNAFPNMSVSTRNLFYRVKSKGGTVCAFYSWEHLRNLAMPGIMDYSFFHRQNNEKDLILLAGAASAHIISNTPNFTFVYFEWTDIIGHKYGWMSFEYLKALEITDHALGLIVAGIRPLFKQEGFSIVVTSDHGGKGKNHTEDIPENNYVPVIICGDNILKNYRIEDEIKLLDLAPTIARLLNIPSHLAWNGKIIPSIFKGDSKQVSFLKAA